jgi:glycerophosphoryl diester phosphodiesterase
MHAAHVPLDIELKNETLSRGQARTIVKRLEAADVWSWDVLAGFDGPMILAGWTQPLAQIRAVAQRRGDPPLLTEYLTVQPDLTPESTTGSAMEAIYFRNVTKDAVIQLHALGLAVDSFTSNKRAFWDALAAADVDWVITDNVVDYQKWAAGQPAG